MKRFPFLALPLGAAAGVLGAMSCQLLFYGLALVFFALQESFVSLKFERLTDFWPSQWLASAVFGMVSGLVWRYRPTPPLRIASFVAGMGLIAYVLKTFVPLLYPGFGPGWPRLVLLTQIPSLVLVAPFCLWGLALMAMGAFRRARADDLRPLLLARNSTANAQDAQTASGKSPVLGPAAIALLLGVGAAFYWRNRPASSEWETTPAPMAAYPDTGSNSSSSSYSSVVMPPRDPVFSPDGRYVACRQSSPVSGPAELLVFDTRTGKITSRAMWRLNQSGELSWPLPERLSVMAAEAQSWKVVKGRASLVKTFANPRVYRLPELMARDTRGSASRLIKVAGGRSEKIVHQGALVSPLHQLGVRAISDRRDENLSLRLPEIWNTKTGHALRFLPIPDYAPTTNQPFAWSPAAPARVLISSWENGFSRGLSMWDARSGQKLWGQSFAGQDSRYEWTPDARFVVMTRVTGSRGRDVYPLHDALLLDARNGKEVRRLQTQPSVMGTGVSKDLLASFGVERRAGQSAYH